MLDVIKLDPKGKNILKRLKRGDGSMSNSYLLVSTSGFVRSGFTEDGRKTLMPSRCSSIIEGDIFDDKFLVKTIGYIEDFGHIITLEE